MEITPFPQQLHVLNSKAKYIAAIAGIQSGKTMTGAVWLLQEILKHPKDDFLICAPTYKILGQSTLKKFFDIFPSWTGVYNKQDQTVQIIGGGKIYIRSTEEPNSIEGMTIRAGWMDEAGMMKSQAWVNIQGRVAIKRGRIIMTTTPYNLGWMYKEVVRAAQGGDENFEVVKWRSIDNPFFPKEEYYSAQKRLSPADFERRYNGEFRKMEGLVYPDWDSEKMITSKIPPLEDFQEIWAGMDYGYSNACAIIVIGLTTDNKLYILDEVYATKLQIDDQVNEAIAMKEKYPILETFYVDPSAPALIDQLNMNGLSAMPANNDVDYGIMRANQIIHNNKLRVSSTNCLNFLDEIELYHYNTSVYTAYADSFPEYKTKPDKVFDHAMDAFRYGMATHPIDIFSVLEVTKEEERTNRFWDWAHDKLGERQENLKRYGADYDPEDVSVMDDVAGSYVWGNNDTITGGELWE